MKTSLWKQVSKFASIKEMKLTKKMKRHLNMAVNLLIICLNIAVK